MKPSTFQPQALPPARQIAHPGQANSARIEHRQAPAAGHFRLSLAPGRCLRDALIEPLQALGVHSASMTILGGRLERLLYCLAPSDPTGERVANYTAPIDAGAAFLLFGNATLGESLQGTPVVHCHAGFVGADGQVRGGHIVVDQSVVAERPLTVLVTSLGGIELRTTPDAETRFALMRPFAPAAARAPAREVADAL